MFDLAIVNGQVMLPSGLARTDIGIGNGVISALGEVAARPARRVIDAAGKLVLPGSIDPHVHIGDVAVQPGVDAHAPDDFFTATRAAAFGGVTTVIDFVLPIRGRSLERQIAARRACADGETAIDYGLHIIVTGAGDDNLDQMAGLRSQGIGSVKLFLDHGAMADDRPLASVLRRAQALDLLVMAHAEAGAVIEEAARDLLARGNTALACFPRSRPAASEAQATARAIRMSQIAGNRLYVVHVSARQALAAVADAQLRGQRVWAETTPHYLSLEEGVYAGPQASHYICSPPIRGQEDQAALWRGIQGGSIHTVGSDHCGFSVSQRQADDFRRIPLGVAGIETRPMVVFSEGVAKGRISLEKYVEVMCVNPARIFGLYPQKGAIAVGSDADLCLIDPEARWTITPQALHFDWGYSPNAGAEVFGKVELVIARGRVIVDGDEFKGGRGAGEFLSQRRHLAPVGFPAP